MFKINRLSEYLRTSSGDLATAIRLYNWNTAVSSAFYGPLQTLEIVFRETLDSALTARFGEEWYNNDEVELDSRALDSISLSKSKISKMGFAISPSKIVANLSFGF